MGDKIIIWLLCVAGAAFSAHAQAKSAGNKIRLGEETVAVRGAVFNETVYATSTDRTKYVAYQFLDAARAALVITEVGFALENGKSAAVTVETYVCPLAQIDRQNSYLIEMEDAAVAGGKYWRLTLLARGRGIDNLNFQKQTRTAGGDAVETKAVNNVTINIPKKADAEKWLRFFTK